MGAIELPRFEYRVDTWEDFMLLCYAYGWKRFDLSMPCRKGYERGNIQIRISFYDRIPSEVIEVRNNERIVLKEFFHFNEILDLVKSQHKTTTAYDS